MKYPGYVGEAATGGLWTDATPRLLEQPAHAPVLVPRSVFYPMVPKLIRTGIRYCTSWLCDSRQCTTATQGWKALIDRWPDCQQFEVDAFDRGGPRAMRKSKHWVFSQFPDDTFFADLRGLLTVIDTRSLRLLTPTDPGDTGFVERLRRAATQNGFTLTEFLTGGPGVIWTIELDADRGTGDASIAR